MFYLTAVNANEMHTEFPTNAMPQSLPINTVSGKRSHFIFDCGRIFLFPMVQKLSKCVKNYRK